MSKIKLKEKVVEEIKSDIKDSRAVIVSDFKGLKVSDLTDLRTKLRETEATATVIKNSFVRRAMDKLDREYPDVLLTGNNLIIRTEADSVKMSKVVVDMSKEMSLQIKGGFLDDRYIDEKTINQLAKLPSREELIAKAVSLIKAPITGLVIRLASPVNGLVNVLNNIKEKK
ncbi:50S ribosomal protein L10 [Candidatus Marinamargulisbacteria bacterium SCGC AG-414-C22]|nr:50S ribosomal protein L10 [Candidatus Marinamargulisbacteria bacterium SCGC AG-414-C22]